jgi:phenylacetate-coenzyme A ligase PaaK-like adenylate-forming protein
MSEFEVERQAQVATLKGALPEMFGALAWSADRIAAEREARLRATLAAAIQRSPWHRQRLGGVDLSMSGERLLAALPPMTKHDLMTNFDGIVTDRRVTLAGIDDHLADLGDGRFFLDGCVAVTSGGSTGQRGCFVYDRGFWARFYGGCFRYILRELGAAGRVDGRRPVMAIVAASHPSHASAGFGWVFGDALLSTVRLGVDSRVSDQVAALNAAQPEILTGYPSALHVLAEETHGGRLRISPRRLMVYSEPLLPEARLSIEAAWGIRVGNLYATSEVGAVAGPCDLGSSHLCEDLMVLEAVDADGRPVPDGTRSAKVYLTTVSNHLLPLIRYEVTDEVTVLREPCPCGSAYRCVADVQGRLDDTFRYDNVIVHPYVFRDALGRHHQVVEYQVRQTRQGAEVDVRCAAELNVSALTSTLTGALRATGLPEPLVEVRLVDRIARTKMGKLRRFVALAAMPVR